MSELKIVYHPKFFRDLDKLSKSQLEIVHKKIENIKQHPEGFKDLKGKNNCHTLRIEHMRLVFYYKEPDLWFLVLESRKTVYEEYLKRLYGIRTKLDS